MNGLIFMLIGLICFVLALFYSRKTHKINTDIDEQNAQILARHNELNQNFEKLQLEYQNVEKNLLNKNEEIKNKTEEIANLYEKAERTAAAEHKLQKQAFTNYCDVLEKAYQEKDAEFETRISALANSLLKAEKDLAQISATRAAARQALQKEQEVKDNKDNYRLIPAQNDLDDIHRLELVKRELHKPRILSMLIWQSFWQPLAKVKFPQILQDKTKCGIYKITNTETDECYIGQSVDIDKRWKDHCKCGLGIDTPVGNKLYKAIQEYGLEQFTFEILAECPREELDEKEKYFIKLYEADTFGYNSKEI